MAVEAGFKAIKVVGVGVAIVMVIVVVVVVQIVIVAIVTEAVVAVRGPVKPVVQQLVLVEVLPGTGATKPLVLLGFLFLLLLLQPFL